VSPHWLLLALAVVGSMGGQTLLKAAAGTPGILAQLLDWRTVVGLGCYGGSALCYILALRRIPMSVALPSTAVGYIAAALIGHYVYGEALGPQQVGGIGLIFAGVVLLALA
jgi:multidrug transporter EmrE-like cation transporter